MKYFRHGLELQTVFRILTRLSIFCILFISFIRKLLQKVLRNIAAILRYRVSEISFVSVLLYSINFCYFFIFVRFVKRFFSRYL